MTLVAHPRHGAVAELRLVPHEFPGHSLFQLPFSGVPLVLGSGWEHWEEGGRQPWGAALGGGTAAPTMVSHPQSNPAPGPSPWGAGALAQDGPSQVCVEQFGFPQLSVSLAFSQLHASSAAWLLQNPAHLRSPPLVPCVAVSQTSELLQALQKPETRACSCYPDFPSCFPRAGPKLSALPELEGSQSVSG